ncbi:MAG: hypothetical protein ABJQ39_05840 [Winogradskyella arenosi]
MHYIILSLLFFIILIGIAYYYDYKKKPQHFTSAAQSIGKAILLGLVYVGLLFVLKSIYELVVPFNKDYGMAFNTKREQLGIPKLGPDWEKQSNDDDQFSTVWWNKNAKDPHFKKVIEYGILNAKSETDYYKVPNKKGTFTWSTYHYGNNTLDYYLEKPNNPDFSVTKSGRLKFAKPTITKKIDRHEFETYSRK